MVFSSCVGRREASCPAMGCIFDARCRRGFVRASWRSVGGGDLIEINWMYTMSVSFVVAKKQVLLKKLEVKFLHLMMAGSFGPS